jgi:hypothetical protein
MSKYGSTIHTIIPLFQIILSLIVILIISLGPKKLQSFDVGDQVSFKHEGKTITGTVIRVNQKSLSVKTKEGTRWYVDPRAGVIKVQQNDNGILYSRLQAGWKEN